MYPPVLSVALTLTVLHNMLERPEVQTRDNFKQRKSKKTLSVFLCTIDRENLHGEY